MSRLALLTTTCALSALSGVFGCAAAESSEETSETSSKTEALGVIGVIPTTVVEDGRQWETRKIVEFSAKAPERNSMPPHLANEALSDAEYAELVKPVKLKVTGPNEATEYRAIMADPQAVGAARAKDRAGVSMRTLAPGVSEEFTVTPGPVRTLKKLHSPALGMSVVTPSAPKPEVLTGQIRGSEWSYLSPADVRTVLPSLLPNAELVSPERVQNRIGLDTRTWVTGLQLFLDRYHRAAVLLRVGTSGYCSATMIGNYTAMTAAHCFHSGGPGGTWLSTVTWEAGYVHYKDMSTFPATEYASQYAGPSSCYTVTIPSAWLSSTSTEFDYAILDFGASPCYNTTVGVYAHKFPPAYGVASDYAAASPTLDAYDVYDINTVNNPPGTDAFYPDSLIGRSGGAGSMTQDTTFSWSVRHYLDTTGGASGGGLAANLFKNVGDPTVYWVGVHQGADSPTAVFNRMRRLNAVMWGLVSSGTTEW